MQLLFVSEMVALAITVTFQPEGGIVMGEGVWVGYFMHIGGEEIWAEGV